MKVVVVLTGATAGAGLADAVAAARAVPGVLVRLSVPPGVPPGAFAEVGIAPGHVAEHRGETPAERTQAIFADFFRRGARQVLVVNGEVAPAPTAVFAEAFAALSANPEHVAVGAASDGFCYALGLAAPKVPDLFTGVRSGTRYEVMDTLRRCEFEERRVIFLPMMDAESAGQVRRLHGE